MKKNSVISGAAILFFANIIVKITGVIFKIPVQRIIGDTGMGYFNVAYSIYVWFYLICTAGLPVAVSICVSRAAAAGNYGRCERIFRVSLITFSGLGAMFTVIMAVFARGFSSLSGIDNAYLCVTAIAPSVFLSCVSSSVRGYYQGHGIMWVTALSQVIESIGKAVFGVIFALYSAYKGNSLYVTSAYAVFGITCGSLLTAIFCIIIKAFYKNTKAENCKKEKVLPELIKTALPVTLSASVMNLTSLIDVFAAPSNLISSGYTELQAAQIYGNYSTLCISFVNLPLSFIYPVTSAVLPALSARHSLGDMRSFNDLAGKVYKYTLFISLPCAVGMGVLSYRVLSVVFPAQSAYLAAPMLTVLSPSVVLCALLAVSDTVLQSCGKPSYPLISMICGASVKLISTFILFKLTPLGRLSIPLGTCLCYLTAVLINAVLSRKRCGILPYYKSVVKPAFCAAVSGAFAYIVNRYAVLYLTETISTIVTILLTCSLYLTFIKLTNYIDKSELYNLLNKKEDRKNGGIQKKREIRV